MVVSEDRRRSSVSPIRERVRRKPRQDWLVAVGQGHSPARTLRRESRGRRNSKSSRANKKFDAIRLSFGGLEQDLKPRRSQSPTPAVDGAVAAPRSPSPLTKPSPRSRRERPGLSPSPKRHPSHAAPLLSPPSAAGDDTAARNEGPLLTSSKLLLPGTPQTDDTSAEPAGGAPSGGSGGDGSPARRSAAPEPPSPTASPSAAAVPAAAGGPKTDWLSAAVGGRGPHGGGLTITAASGDPAAADGGGEIPDAAVTHAAGAERDAKLSSLLLLSPGKEYWAGRLASKGRRDGSESPQRTARSRERSKIAVASGDGESAPSPAAAAAAAAGEASAPLSPAEKGPDVSSGSTWRQQQQQQQETPSGGDAASVPGSVAGRKKAYLSFTAGKRGAPLSPGGSAGSPSVWSTQAALNSPGRPGRVDTSAWELPNKGEASPLSPSSHSSLSPGRGGRWHGRGFSPSGALTAAAGAGRGGVGSASRSLSPGGRGSSFREVWPPSITSPGKDSRLSRSPSPLPGKVTPDKPVAALASPHSGCNRGAGKPLTSGRITSPSSLPRATADSGNIDGGGGGDGLGEVGSPERTTSLPLVGCKSDSPERTGEAVSAEDSISAGGVDSDDGAAGGKGNLAVSSHLFPGEDGASGERRGGDRCGEATALLGIEDLAQPQDSGVLRPGGAGEAEEDPLGPAARPSPLRTQLYTSPVDQNQGPSPCTGHDHHLESFAAGDDGDEGEARSAEEGAAASTAAAAVEEVEVAAEGTPAADEPATTAAAATVATAATAMEDSRPPLHENGAGFRGHAPPGVRVVEIGAVASAATVTDAPSAPAGGVSGGAGGGNRGEAAARSSGGGRGAALSCSSALQGGGRGDGEGGARKDAKLLVSTPTGDGGPADLSLWVTLRNLEEEEAAAAAAAAAVGGGRVGGVPSSSLSLSPAPGSDANSGLSWNLRDSVGGSGMSLPSPTGGGDRESIISVGGASGTTETAEERDIEEGNEHPSVCCPASGSLSAGRGSKSAGGSSGGGDVDSARVFSDKCVEGIIDESVESLSDTALLRKSSRSSTGGSRGGSGSSSRGRIVDGSIEALSDTAPLLERTSASAGGASGASGSWSIAEDKPAAVEETTDAASNGVAAEAVPKAVANKRPTGGSPLVDWSDVGPPRTVEVGGLEGLWFKVSRIFCDVVNFCHPHQGGRAGADGSSS